MIKLNNNAKWGRNPAERQALVTELVGAYGAIVTRPQVLQFLKATNRTVNSVSWLLNGTVYRAGRGQYSLNTLILPEDNSVTQASAGA